MSLRQVIGSVKDQTSIGIAKVASNLAPELEVAIVKATSHDDDPADEKYIRRILNMTSSSRGYVTACVSTVSKRLGKTRDWIVALKTLTLIHRLLNEGDPIFREEIMYATRRGARLLNMSDFKDEAHSSSWDQSAFVRTYGMYLDQKLELIVFERKIRGGGGSRGGANGSAHGEDRYGARDDFRSPPPRGGYEYSDSRGEYGNYGGEMKRSRSFGEMRESREGKEEAKMATPLRDMKIEQIFGKMGHLQRLLERFLGCRPPGLAKNSRLILIALYPIVKESFQIYSDICEVLAVLLDKFFDMEHQDCVKAFDAYASASKQIDELIAFYNWCKDTGVARSSEYPEVQRITGKLLETLEEFVRDRAKRPKSPERIVEVPQIEDEPVPDMNEIKALPAPENYTPPPPPEVKPEPVPEPPKPQVSEPLVDLRDNGVSGDEQGNQLALALFAGPGGNNGNGSWEQFPSNGGAEVTSAWQNPAAEAGKADWELALVETTSNLMNQKAAMGGGLDPLLLNGMYDQGMVRQQVSSANAGGGSASSVAMPGPGKPAGQVLALPAPDGTVQMVNQDPFAASLGIAPPAYVQMADMEKKQNLLVQEQQVWGQYAANGMQGQVGMARVNGNGYYTQVPTQMMPYGMPHPGNGAAGYYNPPPY